MLHQIKVPQFYTDLGLQKTVLNPLANGKFQGLFKASERFSRQIEFFKILQENPLYYQSAFQACVNPAYSKTLTNQAPMA